MKGSCNGRSEKGICGENSKKRVGGVNINPETEITLDDQAIPTPNIVNFIEMAPEDCDRVHSAVLPVNWVAKFDGPILSLSTFSDALSLVQNKTGEKGLANCFNLPQSWKQIQSLSTAMAQLESGLISLTKVQSVIDKKRALKTQLLELQHAHKIWLQKESDSFLQTKEKLLEKLLSDQNELGSVYEMAQDEFTALKNQMDQLFAREAQFKTQQNYLKNHQRDLYRKTNEITKLMDALDPKLQIYTEKLSGLSVEKDEEAVARIEKKLDLVQSEYDELNKERKSLMRQSQEIKKKVLKERKSFQDAKKKIAQFRPQFDQRKSDFEELKTRWDNLDRQIQKLQVELRDYLSNPSDGPQNSLMPPLQYGSLQEIESNTKLTADSLEKIDNFLEKRFKSTDEEKIRQIIKKKHSELQEMFSTLKDEFLAVEDFSEFGKRAEKSLLKFIRFKDRLTSFLTPFNFFSSLEVDILDSAERIAIRCPLVNEKGESIDVNEGLTRVQYAFVYLATLLSVYFAVDSPLIPIRASFLPKKITTKQTFQKAVQMIAAQLSSSPLPLNAKVVLFLDGVQAYDFGA